MESPFSNGISGHVTPITTTALASASAYWRDMTLDLARRNAISANSSYPFGRSLNYLIAHLACDGEGLIPLDRLYEHFSHHLPQRAGNAISRPQFEGHLERWASLTGFHVDDHMLVGARFRDVPLGADARAAFIEGLVTAARD